MSSRHIVRRNGELDLVAPASEAGEGFRVCAVIGEETGSDHTGFAICELAAGGSVRRHVHSFEESVFVLEGEVVVDGPDGSALLRTADYGLLPVGAPHAWRNLGAAPARWAEMTAPRPRARHGGDTLLLPEIAPGMPAPVDVRDPRTRSFGHIESANMEPGKQTQDLLAVSASMRTALLVFSGITVKMMVDSDLGAQLSTMFMVQFDRSGRAGAHDHPFEETYMIVEGAVEATFDGKSYILEAGDVAWAGVGCVHACANPGPGNVRWLETQTPMPPARHSYRFARDWEYLRDRLARPD